MKINLLLKYKKGETLRGREYKKGETLRGREGVTLQERGYHDILTPAESSHEN